MNNNKTHSSDNVYNNIKQTIEHLFCKILPITLVLYICSFFLCDKSYEILSKTVILSEGFQHICYLVNFCDAFNLILSYLIVAEFATLIVLVRTSKLKHNEKIYGSK